VTGTLGVPTVGATQKSASCSGGSSVRARFLLS